VAIVVAPPAVFAAYAILPPPVTPLMLMRLAAGHGLDRRWVPLDAVAPALARAVVAAEDNLFCRHWGFDTAAIGDAVDDWAAGRGMRGASTLSMQTSKNLLLWPGRTLIRKGLEAYATLWLEALLGKRRIIELYLNVAEWGPGLYGAEAAARHHFGIPAAALNRRQAALLAAALPNPQRREAGAPTPSLRHRAAVVDRRVDQLGPLLDCLP
jgi:monofunctional biosynthetic peptidoglycan transglycosylase